jgi:hypothetical protein
LGARPGSAIAAGAIYKVIRGYSIRGLFIRRMFNLSVGLLFGNPAFRSVLFGAVIV